MIELILSACIGAVLCLAFVYFKQYNRTDNVKEFNNIQKYSLYTPKHYKVELDQDSIQLMKDNSFGILLTWKGSELHTSHVPFLVDETNPNSLKLHFHLAKQNPHCMALEEFAKKSSTSNGWNCKVIFVGPHFYISPKWFLGGLEGQKKKVPTWNFTAVHAHCDSCQVYDSPDEKHKIVSDLTVFNEDWLMEHFRNPVKELDDYKYDFSKTDEKYAEQKLKAIVGFTLIVKELKGKFKLSQNLSKEERISIIDGLNRQGYDLAIDTGRNLFYLDQLTRVNQIGHFSADNDEDLYEEEYDEETDEIIQVLVREREPARVINYKQIREMMEKCELSRVFLKVENKLIQTMVDEFSNSYHVRELIIDCRNVDMFSVFDLIVHHCPFIVKVRILVETLRTDCVVKRIYQQDSLKVKCPLKQLRIINPQTNNLTDSTRRVFDQLMENYLPEMSDIEEIALPFWTPSILDSISLNCRHVKKLILLGELAPGEYNQSFENICNNIEALESFIISKSVVRGFYVDIGQAHFMRILTKFSKTLKEFVMGTNLSRFSSPRPEESVQFEEELAANLPTQLETLIIENIPDHYYNSSTPLAFINILTSLFNRNQTNNFQFHFKNLIIDLNNFHLDNFNSISMRHVQNLYLRLSNSEEIFLYLSKREYASNIKTLTLDLFLSTISEASNMLRQPFFSNVENLILVNYGNSLTDLTPLSIIPNIRSLKLMSYLNQPYESLYSEDIPMRNTLSNPGTCFIYFESFVSSDKKIFQIGKF
ncbi:predicted protein [Naegleria gruberi]|uniref:Predicted protein n=1 Tax=Naegleria gruberi TaxID=5762 RepID=D2VHC9_NAEGR|nr:uncharacterized protein NAEGRDRAFT_68172 [Naegleria gruberi]EFC43779.1 predicted protein [Naegleria gruberi]|eukprot:XP_002676523.1 predicted protein [Naegleria gruberi strain NEG-M]